MPFSFGGCFPPIMPIAEICEARLVDRCSICSTPICMRLTSGTRKPNRSSAALPSTWTSPTLKNTRTISSTVMQRVRSDGCSKALTLSAPSSSPRSDANGNKARRPQSHPAGIIAVQPGSRRHSAPPARPTDLPQSWGGWCADLKCYAFLGHWADNAASPSSTSPHGDGRDPPFPRWFRIGANQNHDRRAAGARIRAADDRGREGLFQGARHRGDHQGHPRRAVDAGGPCSPTRCRSQR